MSPPRPAYVQRADATAARRLIGDAIAADPTIVGPPIDVLEITTVRGNSCGLQSNV